MATYDEIKRQCAASGQLWEDPDFAANHNAVLPSTYDFDGYLWKRPKDISTTLPPKFIEAGASRFDLAQGEIGDCWFISSAAVLATKTDLFAQVVPSDQDFEERYIGAFRFKFWQYGEWKEVVVDDRLPVSPDTGKLVYVMNRGQPNEFWGPLLEKAYAKLYGYYYAISNGHIREALVDFTGGLSEIFSLSWPDKLPRNLFDIVRKSHESGSIMGASIWNDKGKNVEEEQNNGLYKGHAYSITGVLQTQIGGSPVQLIRLRNPWGKSEWNGAWSDGSDEWASLSDEEKTKIDLVVKDDGEFWMSFKDMKTTFNTLEIIQLGPSTLARLNRPEKSVKWHCVEHHGKWVDGVNAGGNGLITPKKYYYNNPQYFVIVKHPDEEALGADGDCTMIVSLMLKDYRERRISSAKKNLLVGFDVCQVLNGTPEILGGVSFEEKTSIEKQFSSSSAVREATARFTVKPGTYIIIPYTFKSGQEGPFYLRVFTHTPADTVEILEETGPVEPDAKEATHETMAQCPKMDISRPAGDLSQDLFAEFAGADMVIDARELSKLLNLLFLQEFGKATSFSVEACRTLVAMTDDKKTGVLTFEQTAKFWDEVLFWKKVFEKHDSNASGAIETWELRKVFKAIGFSLSFSTVSTMAVRYGGKNRTLHFEDFVLCISKTLTMFASFKHFSQKSPGEARLDLEAWMETTLSY